MHRHHILSTSVYALVFLRGLYFIPLGALAVCIELGWHA